MKTKWSKEALLEFEEKLLKDFENGLINCPLHLSGGNEAELISIFEQINPQDYVFGTHRAHYHYLLKGGLESTLRDEIYGLEGGMCRGRGRSMHLYDPTINFYTSAIIGGNLAIAVGVAMGIKQLWNAPPQPIADTTAVAEPRPAVSSLETPLAQPPNVELAPQDECPHVWCFLGDGAEDSGWLVECARLGNARDLPITFIVEDNDFSIDVTRERRWHKYMPVESPNIIHYHYQRAYPHVGIGKHVNF